MGTTGPALRTLVLVDGTGGAARLASHLEANPGAPSGVVRVVSRVAEVRDAFRGEEFDVVFLPPRDVEGTSTEQLARVARVAVDPPPVVVAVVAARPGMTDDVLALARAGVHELLVLDVDALPDVAALVRRSRVLNEAQAHAEARAEAGEEADTQSVAPAVPSGGIELFVDPGDAPAHVVAEVLLALDDLHRAAGGGGLTFRTDGEHVVALVADTA